MEENRIIARLNKAEKEKLERVKSYIGKKEPKGYDWFETSGIVIPICIKRLSCDRYFRIGIGTDKHRTVYIYDNGAVTEENYVPMPLFRLGKDLSIPFEFDGEVTVPFIVREHYGGSRKFIVEKTFRLFIPPVEDTPLWYDLEGNELKIGDHVIYIKMCCDGQMLGKGEIYQIKHDEINVIDYDGSTTGIKRGVFKCS